MGNHLTASDLPCCALLTSFGCSGVPPGSASSGQRRSRVVGQVEIQLLKFNICQLSIKQGNVPFMRVSQMFCFSIPGVIGRTTNLTNNGILYFYYLLLPRSTKRSAGTV